MIPEENISIPNEFMGEWESDPHQLLLEDENIRAILEKRLRELDENPGAGISHEELWKKLKAEGKL